MSGLYIVVHLLLHIFQYIFVILSHYLDVETTILTQDVREGPSCEWIGDMCKSNMTHLAIRRWVRSLREDLTPMHVALPQTVPDLFHHYVLCPMEARRLLSRVYLEMSIAWSIGQKRPC